MAITKKPKPCIDAPVGFQTVNGLTDSLESLKDEIEAEHTEEQLTTTGTYTGLGVFENFPQRGDNSLAPTGKGAGAHDNELIIRGTAVVQQVVGDPLVLESYNAQLTYADGALSSMQVNGVGNYFFPMNGWAEVWGKATCMSEVAGGIMIPRDCRVYPSTSGLQVLTFRLQDADGVNDILYPFHTGFFLWAFGRRS